nr:Druantia anti-phage system protein DruA [Halorhodospira halochloris]
MIVRPAIFLIIQGSGHRTNLFAYPSRIIRAEDWQQRYGYRPVLLETFIEWPRHAGTCYKAANWQWVGRTTGRGKKSTSHEQKLPIKHIWLYPLRRDYAEWLCR